MYHEEYSEEERVFHGLHEYTHYSLSTSFLKPFLHHLPSSSSFLPAPFPLPRQDVSLSVTRRRYRRAVSSIVYKASWYC